MKKIERSKEWWLERARREGDAAVGAGQLALDPMLQEKTASAELAEAEETRIAFGRFINLMRRYRGLTIEKLAEAAAIDLGELVCIEDDIQYRPDLRTVHQLAHLFSVSQQRLLQLAGLATGKDSTFRQEVVRFAARSESVQKLNEDEKAALDAFVAVLSKQPQSNQGR